MTIDRLQQELIGEIKGLAQDMFLVNRKGERAAMRGYAQAVPVVPLFANVPLSQEGDGQEFPEEPDLFPYFIVRVDGVEYQKKREDESFFNQAHVMIAFAVYDEDLGMRGYFSLNTVMERVVMRFQENPVLGPFFCERRMNTAYQEDDTFPQFFGAIEMTWNLPEISVARSQREMEDF